MTVPFVWPSAFRASMGSSVDNPQAGILPDDYADEGEWDAPAPSLPALYGPGFAHAPKPGLLERLASAGKAVGHGAKQFGKEFVNDLDFLASDIDTRERAYRAANVAAFFVPPLKVGMTAGLGTRMAVKALESGAITGGLSAIRGHPIVPNAVLGGGLGAAIEGTFTGVRRLRIGSIAREAVEAFRESGAKFSDRSQSPLHNQDWAIVSGQLTDPSRLKLPDDVNLQRHQKLGEEVKSLGYEPIEVSGRGPNEGENSEDAWLVPGMKRKHALELSKAYGQGSVLTSDGLVDFAGGQVYPINRSKTLFDNNVDKTKDYYTESPFGSFSFSHTNPVQASTALSNPVKSGAADTIESMIHRPDGPAPMDKIINMPIRSTLSSWYTKLVRSFHGIEQFEAQMGRGGRDRADNLNIAQLAQLSAGHSAYAQHAFEFGIPDWNDRTKIVAPALEKIFARVNPTEWSTLEQYGFARRFLHLANDRNFKLPQGLTPESLTQFVNEVDEKLPHIKGVFEDYLGWRNELVQQLLVNSKVLGQSAADAMFKQSKDYVPLRAPFDKQEIDLAGNANKFIIRNPIDKIRNIGKQFEPWTHAVIKDLYSWSKIAHQHDIVHELVNRLEQLDPSAADLFAERLNILPPEIGQMQRAAIEELRASDPELAKAAEETGTDLLSLLAPTKQFAHGYIGAFVPKNGFTDESGKFFTEDEATKLLDKSELATKPNDRVKSAAIKLGGEIVTASSHAAAVKKYLLDAAKNGKPLDISGGELGYVTKSGKFLNIQDATANVSEYAGPKLAEALEKRKAANAPGIDSSDLEAFAEEFQPEKPFLTPYKGTQRAWYKVTDPNLWEAFQSMKPADLGLLTKLFAGVASVLRSGATLSLEFMMRNPLKDLPHAGVTQGMQPQSILKGFAEAFGRKEAYQRYLAAGGGRASMVAQDRAAIKMHISDAIGLDETKGLGKIYNVIKSPIEGLQALSDFLETGTRVGMYDQRYKELLRNGIAPAEATRQAALASRNATVDFGVHGSRTNAVRMMTAFWNAQIQGYDNLVRSFKADPKAATMRATAMITLPSVLLYLVNRDDPEYFQLPSWERDMFWHVKMPDSLPWVGDKWMRFPKPFDLGYIFGSSAERFLQYLDGTDKGAVDQLAYNYFSKNFGDLIPIPTAGRPILENLMNRSFLRNRPVESRGMEDIAPGYRVQPGTSDFAAALGKHIDASPIKIDNLIRGYLGGLGKVGSDLGDAAVNISNGKPLLPKDGFFDPRDIPGLRGLFSQFPRQSESVDKLYEVADQIREAEYTRSHLRQTMQIDDLVDWMQHKAILLGSSKSIGSMLKQLKSLREMRDMILRDKTLPSNQRAEQLDMIARSMLNIASAAEPIEGMIKEER